MKKSMLFAAAAVVAMVGCTNEDFTGFQNKAENGEMAINFGSVGKTVTRADKTGADAATLLNNNFVVYGAKYVSSAYVPVFDNYSVNFDGDAGSTESNSAGWEYVGQALSTNPAPAAATTQTIKYWDYAALQYDFVAFSQGKGVEDGAGTKTYATFTQAVFTNLGSTTDPVYTVIGTVGELAEAYVADLVTAYNPDDFQKTVIPKFRNLGAKIRIAIYETIPGYSVKDVKFYSVATGGTASTTPTLFADAATLPAGNGTMNVYFPTVAITKGTKPAASTEGYNNAVIKFDADDPATDATSTVEFEELKYCAAEQDEKTTGDVYLGRTSNTATYAGVKDATGTTAAYKKVIPSGTGYKLNLRVDYVLESINGDGETITVTGATAVVPAIYTEWQPNYAYTYIFKISDQTNGQTGTGLTPAGLYPITFDAVVMGDEDGIQETITEVGAPSITTYQKGKVVTENDEYLASDPIYVVVNDCEGSLVVGSENVNEHVQLFTAIIDNGAIQTITEASVANCFTNGTESSGVYTVTDANDAKLTLTKVASGFTVENTIPATDAPHGVTITKTGAIAKIASPTAATVYAFQYKTAIAEYTDAVASTLKKDDTYYTMDKSGFLTQFTAVGNENFYDNVYYTATATKVSDGTMLTAGTIYYDSENATNGFVANGTEESTTAKPYYTMTATQVTTGTTMAVGTTYYKYNTTTGVPTETYEGDGTTAVDGYSTLTTPAKYAYKVIRVK